MRSFGALRILTSALSLNSQKTHFSSPLLQRFYSAETQRELPTSGTEEEDENKSAVFDSSEYCMDLDFNNAENFSNPTWDMKIRDRVESKIFGEEIASSRILRREEEKKNPKGNMKTRDRVESKISGEEIASSRVLRREQKKKNAALLAMSLLDDALGWQDKHEEDEEEKEVKVEDQKSLNVGIIGAPNAGKSALTNCMVSPLLKCYGFWFQCSLLVR